MATSDVAVFELVRELYLSEGSVALRVPASKCLSHFCCEMLEPKRLYHCHMRAF